jgi:pyruvate/2-oxoglutarate dehydrogenase complex dihydrolipoamide dehydrogenase (E3) component
MGTEHEVDVVVLGVGTCGEDLSLQLLDAGLEVAGVEAALVGGECAYWACIPSKVMIRAATLIAGAGQINGMAGRAEVTPDWGPVAERVRTEVAGGWDDAVGVGRFEARGGRLIHGRGILTSSNTVVVGEQTLRARRGIVIATGSIPAIPPIPGLADADYWTTHDVIQAGTLPDSLIVLGGGAVGCELGQMLTRFGVKVTIVEGKDRLLPLEEPEASAVVTGRFEGDGISVHTGVLAERVESDGGEIIVKLSTGTEVAADRLLVATGRTVDLSGLGLEAAGLDDARFLEVDDRMRAADGIWAIGDVTGKAMFTHVAVHQAGIVAADIMGKNPPRARYDAVPRVTFTAPEVGAVGMTETDARAAGIDVVVAVKQVPATFRGWIHGPGADGFIKLVVDRGAGVLAGATVVGPQAGEVLGLLSLAVHARVPLDQLRTMIYPFPTFHGGIGEALGASGRGVSTVLDPTYDALAELDSVGHPRQG